MTYKPNWADPRTKKTAHRIVLFLENTIGSQSNKSLSSRILRSPRAFGDSELGRYLRNFVLIKTNPNYEPGKFCQQYRINIDRLNTIRDHLGLPHTQLKNHSIESRFDTQQDQVESGEFVYNESGGRYYNGLQNILRDLKASEFGKRGYIYDYDVVCCAPTLFLQRAKQINPNMRELEYIQFYIDNRTAVRDELQLQYGLSKSQVKQIINALFQGGILNTYEHNKILGYLMGNTYKMRLLSQDVFLNNLIDDIKCLWSVLRSDIDTGFEYRGDVRRRKRITGKHKSDYYKLLEGSVMTPIWKYLKKKSVRVFREHDGFRSNKFVAPYELEQLVLSKTGYQVRFDWGKVEVSDDK
jgi:hypothetical protein